MEDRISSLNGVPTDFIKRFGYDYLLEDDYLVPEIIELKPDEVANFKVAAFSTYELFGKTLDQIIANNDWSWIDLPRSMIELIKSSWEQRHHHLLGRFDFAGGIEQLPLKLIELNADTPTMIPESSIVQDAFLDFYNGTGKQMNNLMDDLHNAFVDLANDTKNKNHSILFTSFGYEEDYQNLKPIMNMAESAGFLVHYANFEDVLFDTEDGLLAKDGENYIQFDFLYKLIPWEIICYEEPILLDTINEMFKKDLIYILNPPYTMLFQSKAFLERLYFYYPTNQYLLKTSTSRHSFTYKKFVEKVVFGRLGENIKMYDERGKVIEETKGDFGNYPRIYQEYAPLYKDEDGDIYQPSVYIVNGKASCISFRRRDSLIIDDDSEFIPHTITT